MAHPTGGMKRSSWLTFRRRLLLVRLLLRAPASGAELVAAVRRELGNESFPPAAESALKHDFDALKREFGCGIRYMRSAGRYAMEELGDLALLDLPDEGMEALAFLEASFPAGAALLEHSNVFVLLDRLMLLLPRDRQRQHQERRVLLSLNLGGGAPSSIDAVVVERVKRAIKQHQELLFSYESPSDDGPRVHRVAPYGVFFRPDGHGYLDATLLEAKPSGNEPLYAAIDYRLDRIVPGTAKVLPRMLPAERILPPRYALRYRLEPVVARRRDVAAFFPDTQIVYHDDGSATVTACVTNLWQTRQTLLRYGHACVVEEPAALIELFRETARGLARLYDDEARQSDAAPGQTACGTQGEQRPA
ncbi:MAG: WYL domain-containing protein [Herpetosiphon sp.]